MRIKSSRAGDSRVSWFVGRRTMICSNHHRSLTSRRSVSPAEFYYVAASGYVWHQLAGSIFGLAVVARACGSCRPRLACRFGRVRRRRPELSLWPTEHHDSLSRVGFEWMRPLRRLSISLNNNFPMWIQTLVSFLWVPVGRLTSRTQNVPPSPTRSQANSCWWHQPLRSTLTVAVVAS